MRRYINIGAKITGGLLGVILLLWLGVSLYVQSHKEVLLKTITEQLNEDLSGTLTIESMEPELIRGFPGISVSLKNVLLRDSLWQNHKHNLLDAKKVYLAVDALSLLTGKTKIKKISVEGGVIYIYSDSVGYSNTSLFKKRTGGSQGGGSKNKRKINSIHFSDISFIYDNKLKNKYIDIDISSFTGDLKNNSKGWKAVVDLKSMVNQLEFNVRKGSFIKDKHLRMNSFNLAFDETKKKLTIPAQIIDIEDNNIQIGGFFMLSENSSDFSLDIRAKNIPFKNASALLLPHIIKKLKSYDLKKPVDVQTSITGQLKGAGKQPLVHAAWQVKNNTLTAVGEVIKNCSFTGTFTNQLIPGRGFTDTNSVIVFNNMRGKWYNINFQAPKIQISNLKRPLIEGKFISNFSLKKLNAVSGSETFNFDGGTAALNLLYKAPFYKNDSDKPNFIVGTIRINNAAATYRPRNIKFNEIGLLLNFKGQDVFVKNMQVKSGKTRLFMEGSLRNFLNLYYTDPKKIVLDWHITSPEINLGEYLAFLGKRKSNNTPVKTTTETQAASTRLFRQLDQVLDQANAHMLLKVNHLIYKKFVASNVTSDITMKQSGISINKVSLNHGGGNVEVRGNIDQSGKLNKISATTLITNVDVQKLFTAFGNFGQDAITDENLRGIFFGSTNVSATMMDNGQIMPRSFHGTVSFDIRNGALVNFEPMKKIGDFTFPNRNFSNITFKSLKNTLTLEGNKVFIPPMQIESSVFNIFLNGVYSFTTGTNIALEVPLRNPQKDALLSDSLRETRVRRGIVLNLTAVDGPNGNVKIKLGKKTAKED